MRLLIYSDTHSNWPALQAITAAARGNYDACACLGDVVGYGGAPNRVTEQVRRTAEVVVRGNHDRAGAALEGVELFNSTAAAAARWTFAALEPELRDWLAGLPAGPMAWRGMLLSHGSPVDEDAYIVDAGGARTALLAPPALPYRLQWVGHSHLQFAYAARDGEVRRVALDITPPDPDAAGSAVLALDADRRYLINPGSVGQPRDGDARAAFAIYDEDAQHITLYRVPYDIRAAQAEIQAAGLPASLGQRLARGR